MAVPPKELYGLTEEELLGRIGEAQPGSTVAYAVESEFRRRALIAQISAAQHAQAAAKSAKEATDAAKSTAKWTKYSAIAIAISVVITGLNFLLPTLKPKVTGPQKIAFERKFDEEAVVVTTCPPDPRYASGPNSIATRIYRFEGKLWYDDYKGPRNVEGAIESVCDVLSIQSTK
jgi:hypothetical protein